jgi:hypothetical protein
MRILQWRAGKWGKSQLVLGVIKASRTHLSRSYSTASQLWLIGMMMVGQLAISPKGGHQEIGATLV